MTKRLRVVSLAIFASAAAAFAAPQSRTHYTRTVAIVIYDGVEILDFGGPAEVFQAAANFGNLEGEPAFREYTVSKTTAPITSQGFIRITPDHSIATAPKPDILIIPGGSSGNVSNDPEFMAWVKGAADDAELTLTVCTGAFVVAKLGAANGKEITTFYGAVDSLRKAAPNAIVEPGRRFIDSGRLVTTAGVSAGLDGSLHVVARLLGRATADSVAQYMEYHWSPEPYLAKNYPTLNPSATDHGRALQLARLYLNDGDPARAIGVYRDLIAKNSGDASAWNELGRALVQTKDYAGAIDALRRAAIDPKLRLWAYYNSACAASLAKRPDDAFADLAKAVEAGLDS